MTQVSEGQGHGEVCVTVAAVVNAEDRDVIEAYVLDILGVLTRHYRYFELLLIDNTGASDLAAQLEALQHSLPNIRLIKLSRTYEEEIAYTAALDHSIGDFVVLMAPRTDPPELVPEFVQRCREGLDVVVGRYDRRKEEGWLRHWAAARFYRLLQAMTGYAIEPNAALFRVLSRRVVNAITRIKDKERYLKYLTAYVGYKHRYVPYERLRRAPARKPRGWGEALRLGMDIIVTYSDKPLRLLSLAGVAASLASFLYIVFVLLIALFKDAVPGIRAAEGWASTNAFTAGMFFLLFSMLAVLSEYVLKVLNETQQRPLYHVAYETTSSVLEEQRERVNVV
jgi:dolichol-phosphate mannosyltransferase